MLFDAVGTLPLVRFEGFDAKPSFLPSVADTKTLVV